MKTRARKIEKYNLGPEILDLSWNQGKKDQEISLLLRAKGYNISQPTISRWLEEQRQNNKNRLQQKFTDHVERELPKDLDALEEMENRLLRWAREDPADQAERISLWNRVEDSLNEWASTILAASAALEEKDRRTAIRTILKGIVHWVVVDKGMKADRRADMKLAAGIIEIKLRNAGVIDETDRGQINMKFHLNEPGDVGQKKRPPYKLSLVGGPDHASQP